MHHMVKSDGRLRRDTVLVLLGAVTEEVAQRHAGPGAERGDPGGRGGDDHEHLRARPTGDGGCHARRGSGHRRDVAAPHRPHRSRPPPEPDLRPWSPPTWPEAERTPRGPWMGSGRRRPTPMTWAPGCSTQRARCLRRGLGRGALRPPRGRPAPGRVADEGGGGAGHGERVAGPGAGALLTWPCGRAGPVRGPASAAAPAPPAGTSSVQRRCAATTAPPTPSRMSRARPGFVDRMNSVAVDPGMSQSSFAGPPGSRMTTSRRPAT